MYYEFDEQRRIHQPYTDPFTRVPTWKAPSYNSPFMNWKRGLYAMSTAVWFMEPYNHFVNNVKVLHHFYEWPKTRSEYNIFFKEVFRLPNFFPELFKKISFGLVAAAGDTAVKLSLWQFIHGGTWSPQEWADSNSFKHFICSVAAFTPTAYLTVPFENARRAYYADKTWPIELRKGYTSPINALFRIPFEEGIYYLLKNGFPIFANQWIFWVGFSTIYTFEKNKFFWLWTYNPFSYDYIKFGMMVIAFSMASVMAYPAYFTREMVDIWPKERGGHCTWNNNYRQCFKWMVENMEMFYFNYMPGYWTWIKRYGAAYFICIWMADSLGMYSNCNEPYGSLQTQFPISSEYI